MCMDVCPMKVRIQNLGLRSWGENTQKQPNIGHSGPRFAAVILKKSYLKLKTLGVFLVSLLIFL